MAQAIVADVAIDITGEICPMTFVRTRLALDRLAPGQILSVTLRGEEPLRNVPLSATRQGHTILAQTKSENGTTTLLIRSKNPSPAIAGEGGAQPEGLGG